MKQLIVLFGILLLCACATEPEVMQLPPPEGLPQPQVTPNPPAAKAAKREFHIEELQSQLGMSRQTEDLGFDERSFNDCDYGLHEDNGQCNRKYLSVVHFRLLCRDSVETTENVASNFTPLVKDNVEWRLAGVQGHTQTDSQGFGQVRMISSRATKAQRFMLIIGTRSLGVEAGEVTQIIVPGNWCSEYAWRGN